MKSVSHIDVQFTLDDDEKETLVKAYEIIRKVKCKFLNNKMERFQKSAEDALNLMSCLINNQTMIETK